MEINSFFDMCDSVRDFLDVRIYLKVHWLTLGKCQNSGGFKLLNLTVYFASEGTHSGLLESIELLRDIEPGVRYRLRVYRLPNLFYLIMS